MKYGIIPLASMSMKNLKVFRNESSWAFEGHLFGDLNISSCSQSVSATSLFCFFSSIWIINRVIAAQCGIMMCNNKKTFLGLLWLT